MLYQLALSVIAKAYVYFSRLYEKSRPTHVIVDVKSQSRRTPNARPTVFNRPSFHALWYRLQH